MTKLLDRPVTRPDTTSTNTHHHTPHDTPTQHHAPPHHTADHTIRPLRPDDIDRVQRFFGRLSLDSAYRRFFTGGRPGDMELRRLFNAEPGTRDALLALAGGEVVGLAEGTPNRRLPEMVEIGVVVADAWQHNGIGLSLVRTLTHYAAARGALAVRADTQADNYRMARIMRRLWPDTRPQLDGPLHTWCVPVNQSRPPQAES
jgi:RimJ/RimL family protein N-acetyltransferase